MKTLKIRSYGMLSPIGTAGSASSWVYTIHNLAKCFEQMGHELFLLTTNGTRGIDKSWFKCFRDCNDPDIDMAYTLPPNMPHRVSGSLAGTTQAKLRCLIFNYESSILPPSWAPFHKYCDFILASSEYVADIFIRAGIPSSKVVVMPLGVDFETLRQPMDSNFELKTKKRFKLLNISIPHARKNIPLLIDAYFEEFSASDDICLIIKTSLSAKQANFEINVMEALNALQTKYRYKQLPEIELIDHRFDNIATLYNKSNALINVAASEGFGLPLIEAMACGKLVAAPRYGGVLDFLEHNKNSLLIDTIEITAPAEMQYWEACEWATVGLPMKESVQKTMRNMYENEDILKNKFEKEMIKTSARYTWNNAANLILELYNGNHPKKIYGELL